MARPKKNVQSVELRLSVSRELRDALDNIALAGLAGSTANEVAVRLIEEGIGTAASRIVQTRSALEELNSSNSE